MRVVKPAAGRSKNPQAILFGNSSPVVGSSPKAVKRKAEVIARYEVIVDGKTYPVVVLAPKKDPEGTHIIPARDDSRGPYQRFIQAQHA